jgi:hypothetical protein
LIEKPQRQEEKIATRNIYQEQVNHRRMLNEEKPPTKVQNRKSIFATVTFVVNVGKNISRQHQNITGISVENAENVSMNPVQCMGCYIINVEGIRREKKRRNEKEGVKRPVAASVPHLREMPQVQSFLFFAHVITFL